MSSVFEVETKLILMFTNAQSEVKKLTPDVNTELIQKQKNDLFLFQKQLEEYKIIIELKKKENSMVNNTCDELNCKK